jgi:hypothetical protein
MNDGGDDREPHAEHEDRADIDVAFLMMDVGVLHAINSKRSTEKTQGASSVSIGVLSSSLSTFPRSLSPHPNGVS